MTHPKKSSLPFPTVVRKDGPHDADFYEKGRAMAERVGAGQWDWYADSIVKKTTKSPYEQGIVDGIRR